MTKATVLALAPLLAACAPKGIPVTEEFLADREGRIARALAKAGVAPAAKASTESELRRISLDMVAQMAQDFGLTDEQLVAMALNSARYSLKDPESAQFRAVRLVPYKSGKVVCGYVNAKN